MGLVSVSFRPNSPEEILRAAKEAGLACIEWGSDIHAPCADTARLREIAELQRKYGIYCSSYGTYFRLGETPISEFGGYIDAAEILGTRVLRLWCGGKSGADMNAEERERLLSDCREAAMIAEARDVVLCTECHRKTFTERLDDALYLMQEINSPNFRTYWQPFQWETVENNLKYAEEISTFAEHIHVFQWKKELKFSLNEGVEEWRRYLLKLPAPRTLLLEFMPDNCIGTLKTEAEALRRIAEG